MDSKAAVGAEGRGMKAAGVLGTEPVQGSDDTLADMAYCTGRMHKGYSPWAWAFGNTRDILDRWGREAPGPAEGELSQESGMQQVQESQSLRELRQQQQVLDLLET